ncbi:MAG TPA: hypothetical protein VGL09_15300 [Methylomirabilota bacterium]
MTKDVAILRSADEPRELIDTAVEFAASERAADQAVLLGFLNSSEFLLRVNTAHEYATARPKQLRVAKVIRVLRDSPYPAAKATLIRLAEGGDFVRTNWLCQELLVRALVSIRPAPPEAVRYWDQQSTPTAVNRHVTIEMLCENETDPALALLEQKLLDPAQEREFKVAWIRDPMLRHRNDEPLLRASERMITHSLPPDLRLVLLEALCTYDRGWYPGCAPPKPPPRALASAEARQVLRRICRYALEHLELSASLEAAVRATLVEIGDDDARA